MRCISSMKEAFRYNGLADISNNEIEAVVSALSNGHLCTGIVVKEFEKLLSEYIGIPYTVCVNSGSSALYLALKALGVGIGDEVITTPITFVATINAIKMTGATPIFVDINNQTFNLDEKKVAEQITTNTKVILPVELGGLSINYNFYLRLKRKYNVEILVDSEQSLSAVYNEKRIGGISRISTTSFFPTKPITTGIGGAIFTTDLDLYDKLVILRHNGLDLEASDGIYPYDQKYISLNYRLSDLHAAIGIQQLKRIDKLQEQREKIRTLYLEQLKCLKCVFVQHVDDLSSTSSHLFLVKFENQKIRDGVFMYLKNKNIGVQIHYKPVFLNSLYKFSLNYLEKHFPNSINFGTTIISLPIHTKMSKSDVDYKYQI